MSVVKSLEIVKVHSYVVNRAFSSLTKLSDLKLSYKARQKMTLDCLFSGFNTDILESTDKKVSRARDGLMGLLSKRVKVDMQHFDLEDSIVRSLVIKIFQPISQSVVLDTRTHGKWVYGTFDGGSSTVTHDRLGMGVKGKTWYGICDGRVRGVADTNEDKGIQILTFNILSEVTPFPRACHISL